MQLVLLHPHVANRDCQHCLKYFYEEEGENKGRVKLDKSGEPLVRPRGTRAPCQDDRGCPKGSPDKPIELTEQNRKAFHHYRRCKLTGRWPDDEWFIQMAVALDDTVKRVESVQRQESLVNAALMGATRMATGG